MLPVTIEKPIDNLLAVLYMAYLYLAWLISFISPQQPHTIGSPKFKDVGTRTQVTQLIVLGLGLDYKSFCLKSPGILITTTSNILISIPPDDLTLFTGIL